MVKFNPTLAESLVDDDNGVFVTLTNRQVSDEAKEEVKVVEGEAEEKKPEHDAAPDVKPEEAVEEKKEEEEEDNVSVAVTYLPNMIQLHVIWSCKQCAVLL